MALGIAELVYVARIEVDRPSTLVLWAVEEQLRRCVVGK